MAVENLIQNEPHLQQDLDSAEKKYAAGQLSDAAAFCLQILKDTPAQPRALHLLGLIRFQESKTDEAVALFQQAIHEAPDFAAAHNHLGALLITIGQAERAIESLQNAIDLRPDYSEAHSYLGNAAHKLGRFKEAEKSYRSAIKYGPNNTNAYVSLGNLLCDLRKPNEAVECFLKAISITPNFAMGYYFLGKAYQQQGQTRNALASYQKANELQPAHPGANFEQGIILKNTGHVEEALNSFKKADSPESRPKVLECLLKLKNYDEFFSAMENYKNIDRTNLNTVAISAYASQQLGRDDPHPFGPDPINRIRIIDDLVGADGTDQFIDDILAEVNALPQEFEPPGITTKGGFQTGGNLFTSPTGALGKIHQIFQDQINSYFKEIESEQTIFVQERPRKMNLRGWYVRYLNKGFQGGHIHAKGWLTCVIYLRMPKTVSDSQEGAIKFTLKDDLYPEIKQDVPNLVHMPVDGQIVLFPSWLYHYTIPVTTDQERLMIASDLLPDDINFS